MLQDFSSSECITKAETASQKSHINSVDLDSGSYKVLDKLMKGRALVSYKVNSRQRKLENIHEEVKVLKGKLKIQIGSNVECGFFLC